MKHFRDVAQQLDYLEFHDQYRKFWKKHRKQAHATFNITADTFSAYIYYKDSANPAYNECFDYAFMEKLEEVINSRGIDIHYNTNEIQHEIMNSPITQTELSHAIRKSKVGKACGSDAIPVEFYKHGEEMLHKAILALSNYVFHNGAYPQIWSEGIVNPIFKTGKMTMPDNYRKITPLSSLGKLFDSILNNRLCFCKEVLQSENPWQNGFKRGTQSTDNLFILNGVVEKYQAQKRPVYMCFVDFKSAFDYINRHVLLFKLISEGYAYNGRFLKIMQDLFKKARSKVKCNMETGEMFDNICGVLQGGVISPSLFKLYIVDMCQYLGDSTGVTVGGTLIKTGSTRIGARPVDILTHFAEYNLIGLSKEHQIRTTTVDWYIFVLVCI